MTATAYLPEQRFRAAPDPVTVDRRTLALRAWRVDALRRRYEELRAQYRGRALALCPVPLVESVPMPPTPADDLCAFPGCGRPSENARPNATSGACLCRSHDKQRQRRGMDGLTPLRPRLGGRR